MTWRRAVIDRSPAQKKMRIELARLELEPLGYSVVKSSLLSKLLKRLPPVERAEAVMEMVR